MGKRKMACVASALAIGCGFALASNVSATDDGKPFCLDGGECYGALQEAFDMVPNDGTLTTIYLDSTEGVVYDGGGAFYTAGKKTKDGVTHPANGNYNVVFDLRGKTYVISGAPVGSTGYETQAFHLERGGKFTFKDGTIKAASGSGVWFILQNYANTTLDNATLDATDNSSITYVASNNFGSLTVKGDSQILASDGKVAFDLWYGMSAVYDGGIAVTFGDDFTGRVEGIVEYGHHSRVTDENWQEKAELNISGGTFDITFRDGSTGALDGANINIDGGVFSAKPDETYLAEGYVSVLGEERFEVISRAAVDPADEIITETVDGEEVNVVMPKKVDYSGVGGISAADVSEDAVSGWIWFEEEFIDDREHTLVMIEQDASELMVDSAKGGELIGAVNITMKDRNGDEIDVKDTKIRVFIDIPEDVYNALATYDKVQVVYFENGTEKERLDAEIVKDEDLNGEPYYYLTFVTAHFSTYGVVGVNEEAAAAPETGTVTVTGASARVASLMTAAVVGVLTSIVSFAYLIRKQ